MGCHESQPGGIGRSTRQCSASSTRRRPAALGTIGAARVADAVHSARGPGKPAAARFQSTRGRAKKEKERTRQNGNNANLGQLLLQLAANRVDCGVPVVDPVGDVVGLVRKRVAQIVAHLAQAVSGVVVAGREDAVPADGKGADGQRCAPGGRRPAGRWLNSKHVCSVRRTRRSQTPGAVATRR